jgi:hypothetical protein
MFPKLFGDEECSLLIIFIVWKYPDGFSRARWACYLTRPAAVALFGVNHRYEGVFGLYEDVTDCIIRAPSHTSRAFAVLTEEAKVHIDPGEADFYIRFVVEPHA